jgi:putative DNA primase/helicase
LCPTNFNPDAPSYHFDRFLEGVFDGHGPTIDFLQRLFGYCLTGDVREQILPVFHGVGSNGKSTLLTAIGDTLGTDFSAAAPPSLLIEKKTDSHPTELASLFGRRLVIAQETNAGARLAEDTIKKLTGTDIISARRMREDFWDFAPTHKVVLVTNHRPRVVGTDHAIWRRLVLVPFARKFWNPDNSETGPDDLKQDKTLAAKLAAERDGILAWMVRGCLDWQRGGLRIPDSVRAATAEYRTEQDTLGRFVASCCCINQGVKVKFSSLYDELEKWCNEGGDNLPSRRFVGTWLKESGYQERTNNGRWYLGIGLKADYSGTG